MQNTQTYLETLGIESLSPMQSGFISAASAAGDIILLSPTGTGKTLAYLISALNRADFKGGTLRCVAVMPSRELAMQSEALLKRMAPEVKSLCLIGGHKATEEAGRLALGADIVFATPGRLRFHLEQGHVEASGVSLFVIDEFDKCLEQGFTEEMTDIRRMLPGRLDTWLISATDKESQFAGFVRMERVKRLDYTSGGAEIQRVEPLIVHSPVKDKLETLAKVLTHAAGSPTIVFVSYRESAERVGAYLKSLKYYSEVYHGGLEQRDRERALYKFRSGGSNVLVSTDLAARGLDIPEVKGVVHYHLPPDEVAYEHRNGRSTRWENCGTAYAIVGPEETVPDFLAEAETLPIDGIQPTVTVPEWATVYIGRGRKDKLSKGDVAGFLCKKGGLKADDLGRIDVGPHYAYAAVKRKKLKSALKAVAGEKIKGMKTLIEEMR